MKLPELYNRTPLQSFCVEEAERLGRTVLLLPVTDPLIVPKRLPKSFVRKDREGGIIHSRRPIAFDPGYALDAAGGLSLSFNSVESHVGVHLTETPGDWVTDLMSTNPGDVAGEGYLMVVDGLGWRAEGNDQRLTPGARFTQVTGRVVVLGIGVIVRDDLATEIRCVADPAMEHYQQSTPIGI